MRARTSQTELSPASARRTGARAKTGHVGLDRNAVIERIRDVFPEPVRAHGVRIDGVVYPVKQAFELASSIPRADFTSQTAMRHLRALGFDIVSPTTATGRTTVTPRSSLTMAHTRRW